MKYAITLKSGKKIENINFPECKNLADIRRWLNGTSDNDKYDSSSLISDPLSDRKIAPFINIGEVIVISVDSIDYIEPEGE